MSSETGGAVWFHAPDIAFIAGKDRYVLLKLSEHASLQPLVLEGPAAAIWQAIDGKRSTQCIVDVVGTTYPDSPSAAPDILRFLTLLRESGLLCHTEIDT
jgi:hypothetical protein